MSSPTLLIDPVAYLLGLLPHSQDATPPRIVIGLVGLPGSGKSTLAAKLVDAVNERTQSATAMALSMDGFHLSKAALAQFADPQAALVRRGSPWTFDAARLAMNVQHLREKPDKTHTWPAFEHGVGDPVEHALVILPHVKLLIVEGLYLLHRAHGWQLKGLLDECWYLDIPMDVAMQRLVNRHMVTWSLSQEQALARLAVNDRLNADIVLQTRGLADKLIT